MSHLIVRHPYVIILGLIFSAIISWLYYHKDKNFSDIKRLWVYTMAFLRFVSIFLLFLLLADIIIKSLRHIRNRPIIIWLQDNSQSIPLATDSSYIAGYLANMQKVVKELQQDYDLRFFVFDKSLKQAAQPDFKGTYTDISGALEQIRQRFYNENVGMIILASDGIYNTGINPAITAANLPYPITTILLGDTNQHQDIKIDRIRTNEIAYLEQQFPVQAEISAYSAKGNKLKVSLFMNNRLISQKEITVTSANYQTKVNFFIKAQNPGKKLLTVKVQPLAGERNKANNIQTAVIDIINSKEKILILSAFPHPDIAAIRRILSHTPTYEVRFSYLNKFHGKLDNYSLIILYQLPTEKNSVENIFSQISASNKPVLIICGGKTDYNRLSAMPLGFKFSPVAGSFDQSQPMLNEAFVMFVPDKKFKQLQDNLPPLVTVYADFQNINSKNILLYQKVNNIPTGKPLILLFDYSPLNNNKLGIILGEGLWRWPMAEYKNTHSSSQTEKLFTQIIQYLTASSNKKRFIVKVNPVIDQNQNIIFTAELYDKSFNPVTQPLVKLNVRDSAGKTFNYIMEARSGYYFLDIGKFSSGIYTYVAQTQLGDQDFVEKGSFAVKPINKEAVDLMADKKLMQKLSLTTGGKFLTSNEITQLHKLLEKNENLKSIITTEMIINDLLNHKLIFFIILISLSLEWGMRKFFGNL